MLAMRYCMPDNPKIHRKDRAQIALTEPHEVRYWSQKFGVSREELVRVVRQVGSSVARVRARLEGGQAGGKGERKATGAHASAARSAGSPAGGPRTSARSKAPRRK